MTATVSVEERELWRWVDRLTESTRRRVERDDGPPEHVTVPSLWQQLIDPETVASSGNGAEGRTALGSKPPLDLTVVDLATDIAATTARALLFYKIKGRPFPQTDRNLRALALHLVALRDRDKLNEWADQARQWVGQIHAALPREEGAPIDLAWRGYPCPDPDCRARYIERQEAGETFRDPAVVVNMRNGRVAALTCHACKSVWWRGADLDALVDYIQQQKEDAEAA